MLCNRNQLSKESGIDFPGVERILKRTGLKKAAEDSGGRPLYELSDFTNALEQYRELLKESRKSDRTTVSSELEDERLREIIRGLKLKNNILSGQLIDREDVFQYISRYVSSELIRVKRLCLQQIVLKGRNKSSTELRHLGMTLYNDYVSKQKDFVSHWMKSVGEVEDDGE